MTERIRFGYHGSRDLAERLVRAAGGDREFSFVEYDVSDPFRALRAGSLDVMITKFSPSEADLAYSAVVDTDARAAILGAEHPLADRSSVSVEELADYDGFQCPGTFPPQVWDEVVPPVTPGGRTIRRRYSLTSTAALMDLVVRHQAVHISLLSLADVAPPAVRVVPDPASHAQVVAAAIPTLLGATTRGGRPEVLAAVRAIVSNTSPDAIAWSQLAIASRQDAFDVLRATHVPSVVVADEEDELVALASARLLASALPDAELVTVPQAGHLAPMEAP